MAPSFWGRAIFPYLLSSRIFLYWLTFLYVKWPDKRYKQSGKLHVKDKRKVLAFVVPGKEGGRQTLNHFDIRHKSSQILTKNKSGSLAKSLEGLFTKTLLPQKLKCKSSFDHLQMADRREKTSHYITTSTKIHSQNIEHEPKSTCKYSTTINWLITAIKRIDHSRMAKIFSDKVTNTSSPTILKVWG